MPLTVLTHATSLCYSPTLTRTSLLQLLIIQSTLYTPWQGHHHHNHPHHHHHPSHPNPHPHPLPPIIFHSPLLPFPPFLGNPLLILTRPNPTHLKPRPNS